MGRKKTAQLFQTDEKAGKAAAALTRDPEHDKRLHQREHRVVAGEEALREAVGEVPKHGKVKPLQNAAARPEQAHVDLGVVLRLDAQEVAEPRHDPAGAAARGTAAVREDHRVRIPLQALGQGHAHGAGRSPRTEPERSLVELS